MTRQKSFSEKSKNIVSGSHYLDFKSFAQIVRLCNLNFVQDFETWQDEFGNLLLLKDNKMEIQLTKEPKDLCSDFLIKACISSVLRFTKYVFFRRVSPKIFCFVGQDGLLRAYKNNKRIPSLSVGRFILKDLAILLDSLEKGLHKKKAKIIKKKSVFKDVSNSPNLIKQMSEKYVW
jgi:hypothetical protein